MLHLTLTENGNSIFLRREHVTAFSRNKEGGTRVFTLDGEFWNVAETETDLLLIIPEPETST